MKKIVLTFISFLSLGLSLMAQNNGVSAKPGGPDAEMRAKRSTEAQAKELGLSEDQKAKFIEAKVDRINKIQALNQKYGVAKKDHKDEYKAIQQEFKTKVNGFLTADQYTKWDEGRTKRMAARKAKMEQKSNANPSVPKEKFEEPEEFDTEH